jgi:hypothetical protein
MKPIKLILLLLACYIALGISACEPNATKTINVESGGGNVVVNDDDVVISGNNNNGNATRQCTNNESSGGDQGICDGEAGTTSTTEPYSENNWRGIPGCSSEESYQAGFCNG